MARARKRDEWQRSSMLAALIHNANSRKKKTPEDFDPIRMEDKRLEKIERGATLGDRIREVNRALKAEKASNDGN